MSWEELCAHLSLRIGHRTICGFCGDHTLISVRHALVAGIEAGHQGAGELVSIGQQRVGLALLDWDLSVGSGAIEREIAAFDRALGAGAAARSAIRRVELALAYRHAWAGCVLGEGVRWGAGVAPVNTLRGHEICEMLLQAAQLSSRVQSSAASTQICQHASARTRNGKTCCIAAACLVAAKILYAQGSAHCSLQLWSHANTAPESMPRSNVKS
jgi:hypothetical protein